MNPRVLIINDAVRLFHDLPFQRSYTGQRQRMLGALVEQLMCDAVSYNLWFDRTVG